MSIYSLILMVIFCISLFSAALILAACITSSRSKQVVARQNGRLGANQSFETLASDLRKHQSMAGGNTVASSH